MSELKLDGASQAIKNHQGAVDADLANAGGQNEISHETAQVIAGDLTVQALGDEALVMDVLEDVQQLRSWAGQAEDLGGPHWTADGRGVLEKAADDILEKAQIEDADIETLKTNGFDVWAAGPAGDFARAALQAIADGHLDLELGRLLTAFGVDEGLEEGDVALAALTAPTTAEEALLYKEVLTWLRGEMEKYKKYEGEPIAGDPILLIAKAEAAVTEALQAPAQKKFEELALPFLAKAEQSRALMMATPEATVTLRGQPVAIYAGSVRRSVNGDVASRTIYWMAWPAEAPIARVEVPKAVRDAACAVKDLAT